MQERFFETVDMCNFFGGSWQHCHRQQGPWTPVGKCFASLWIPVSLQWLMLFCFAFFNCSVTVVFFVVSGLDLLKDDSLEAQDKEVIIEWIYSMQLKDEGKKECLKAVPGTNEGQAVFKTVINWTVKKVAHKHFHFSFSCLLPFLSQVATDSVGQMHQDVITTMTSVTWQWLILLSWHSLYWEMIYLESIEILWEMEWENYSYRVAGMLTEQLCPARAKKKQWHK